MITASGTLMKYTRDLGLEVLRLGRELREQVPL